MSLNHFHSCTIPAVTAVALATVIGVDFYRVRELLAALLIFTVLFCTAGMALLILFLLQESALRGMTYCEAGMARVRARHTVPCLQPHNFPRSSP